MNAQSYRVRVDYRTQTSANSKTVDVVATSYDDAFAKASAAVSRPNRRVDGGTLVGQPIDLPASTPIQMPTRVGGAAHDPHR